MTANNRQKARAAATALLAKHGVTAPPVDVRQIAEREGITFDSADLDDSAPGFKASGPVKTFLVLNANHGVVRQRFTIAHALGQQLLDPGEALMIYDVLMSFRGAGVKPLPSVFAKLNPQANAFAGELLMPESFLRHDFAGGFIDLYDDVDMRQLANRYQVTVAALAVRLVGMRMLRG